ncbi:MAG: hypothetical protein FWD64_04625 [Acidobacteriaceae bacterium]|nr:hypothetical protein [Acidobacteriaceae bacterium]
MANAQTGQDEEIKWNSYDDGYNDGFSDGEREGEKRGYKEGFAQGFLLGHEAGLLGAGHADKEVKDENNVLREL